MTKPNFSLLTGITGRMQEIPEPELVRVPLRGHSTKTIKKKAPVNVGTLVAEHPDPFVGDAHSPIQGVVVDVTDNEVVIAAGEAKPAKEGEPAPTAAPVPPVDLAGLGEDDLRTALKSLGVSTGLFPKAATLIINALNPEPGTGISEVLMGDHRDTVEMGLDLVLKMVEPNRMFLAVPEGKSWSLPGFTTKEVRPYYPNSQNPLVIKALTGAEQSYGVCVVSILEVHGVGRVVRTKMPLIQTALTVGKAVYRIKVGTPLSVVLAQTGLTAEPADRVVLGGPMRGRAASTLEIGVSKDDYALTVVPQHAFPPVTDQPCINCGECALVCPARLMPGFVTRYVEFKMYDKAAEFFIDSCMECGLCGYVCTARRPMLQLIRLGKKTLEIQASALKSSRLQGE